eukprot:jgi/Botrbrau1/1441/Bobra.0063s0132.1
MRGTDPDPISSTLHHMQVGLYADNHTYTPLAPIPMTRTHARSRHAASPPFSPPPLSCIPSLSLSSHTHTHTHMHVAVGDEGYHTGRTNGVADWLDDGLKGLDFEGNLADPNIDFGTVHLYPESWGFKANDFWLGENFIVDRANIAHSLNKPVILEEIGLEAPNPLVSRNRFFEVYFSYANSVDYAGVLVWQVYAWPILEQYSFNFDWLADGAFAIKRQIADTEMKNRGTYVPSPIPSVSAPAPPFPPSPPPDPCPDIIPPTNGTVDCRHHAFYGQCNEKWMVGFCLFSCGLCNALPPAPVSPPPSPVQCTDVSPPGNNYTCAQQAGWGKCNETFMAGYCLKSCGICFDGSPPSNPPPAPRRCLDIPPPGNNFTCAQQAGWGKSCGICFDGSPPSNPPPAPKQCLDIPPPGNDFTCAQQAGWGKSCGICSDGSPPYQPPPAPKQCLDIPPPGNDFTCAQQAGWGKSCGICSDGSPPYQPPPAPKQCLDIPPPGNDFTCTQQAGWGKSCGICSDGSPPYQPPPAPKQCLDIPPLGNDFTCAQQAGWGKSCGICSDGSPPYQPPPAPLQCLDVPPPGNDFTCAQQAGWGKVQVLRQLPVGPPAPMQAPAGKLTFCKTNLCAQIPLAGTGDAPRENNTLRS